MRLSVQFKGYRSIGKANETFFSIIAGIGLDAQTMKDADRNVKDKLGFVAYGIAALQNMGKKRRRYLVTIDSRSPIVYKAKSILVANMGEIMGGIALVPKASPQSGNLRIGIIQAASLHAWVSICYNALRGKIDRSPYYVLLKGERVQIHSLSGPEVYQCDGNEFPATEDLTITVYPKSISVMIRS